MSHSITETDIPYRKDLNLMSSYYLNIYIKTTAAMKMKTIIFLLKLIQTSIFKFPY